jgi:predicted type IV restriction endonuclease
MWDLIRSGEFLEAFVIYKDTSADNTSPGVAWYRQVYSMHNITEEQFRKSYAYYKAHPQLMKDVLDSLTKMKPFQPKDTASVKADSIKTDSIRRDSARKLPPIAIEDSMNKKGTSINRKKASTLTSAQRRKFIDSLRRRKNFKPGTPLPD